ncbi:MAG: hypothetical protein JO329_21865, partial [Planctomycetaceae bacterium]|nr:hypothetical protein [Planctomycetaceae bacterium]
IERCIARELEGDQVEGIPAPPRPIGHRPQPRPSFRRGPARRRRLPHQLNAPTFPGIRRRRERDRDREPQGASRA